MRVRRWLVLSVLEALHDVLWWRQAHREFRRRWPAIKAVLRGKTAVYNAHFDGGTLYLPLGESAVVDWGG